MKYKNIQQKTSDVQLNKIKDYLSLARKNKILSKKEERELIEDYLSTNNQKSLNKLVESNMGFIVGFARAYCKKQEDLEDLVQVASIGFIRSIQKFNLNMDVRLSTYSAFNIKDELIAYLRKYSNVVNISYTTSRDLCDGKFPKIKEEIEGDVMLFLEEKEEQNCYLESDVVANKIDVENLNQKLYKILELLPYKDQLALEYFYELRGREKKQNKQIGRELGMCQDKVVIAKRKSLKVIKELFKAFGLENEFKELL